MPDHGDHIERWAQASARAREQVRAHLDVPYGTHPRQRLDIFPTTAALAPALVYIHGGGWVGGTKESNILRVLPYLEMGWAVARLWTDDWRLPAIKTYLNLGFEPDIEHESHPERWRAVFEKLGNVGPRWRRDA